MASSDYGAPSQEAEKVVEQSEAKKITEEDSVYSPPKVSVEIQKPEELAPSAPDVNPKVEGIQETAPLAESSTEEKIVDKPMVEEGAQGIAPLAESPKEKNIFDKPKVEQGAQEIAPLDQLPTEEKILDKPGVEEGTQEIAPLSQSSTEEKIVEKPKVQEGIQEIAALAESSNGDKIVDNPKVEEGAQEIAPLAEPSNDEKIVHKPRVEKGDLEIVPLAQSSTEEAIVDKPKVEEGAREIASLVDSSVEEKNVDKSQAPLPDSERILQDRPMESPAAEEQDKIKSATEESKPTEPEDKKVSEVEKFKDRPVEEEKKIEDVPVDIQQVGKETDAAEPSKEKSGPDLAEKPVVKSVEETPQKFEKLVDVPASSPAVIHEKTVELPSAEVQTNEAKDVAVSETLEPEPGEKPVVESVEGTPQEPEKIVNMPGSSPPEAIQEKAVELPSSVVQTDVVKDVAEKTSEPALEEKLPQQSEQVQLIPKESPVAAAAENDEIKSSVDEAEDVDLPKEVETTSDQTIAVPQVEERDVECYPIDNVSEQNGKERENTEIKGLPEAKSDEAKIVTPEAIAEEKITVAEELVRCEEKPTGGVTNSLQLSEKAAEENVTSRGTDLKADNGSNKDEKVDSSEIEGTKDAERLKEADKAEQTVQATEVKFEEGKPVDEQIKETAEPTKAKLEEEEQVDEPVKTEIKKEEVAVDDEGTKTSKDITKEDVPVKTNKPSIVKMVKQSLVKAKKAIIGKSHNSKTQVPPPKDDGSK